MSESAAAAGWIAGKACYNQCASNPNEIWKGDNVLSIQLTVLAAQVVFTVFATRFFYYILRPFHQPRLVAEMLTGFLLSSALLEETGFFNKIYPLSGVLSVETIAHLGITYYVFLCGLEMNLETILKARKKATIIAIAGIIIPMAMGAGLFAFYQKFYRKTESYIANDHSAKAYLFWNLALTVTGFPVLANILADLKLLYTGLGRVALTSAMITDIYNWFLFILLTPFAINNERSIFSVLSTLLFILFCFYVLRPLLGWIIDSKTNDESWEDQDLILVLIGALACAFVTDVLGTHSIVGAFVYGLILPHERFADLMMEKSDEFVSGILSPLFFAGTGVRFNSQIIVSQEYWPVILLVVILLCFTKVLSTVIATWFLGMPARDGIGLGLLMNTKGVLSLIILNIAWDKRILNRVSFSIMVAAVLIMTVLVSPIINFIFKPRKRFEQYKLRTVQNLKFDADLRILACVHNTRQAAGMVNFLEAFNSTKSSPLNVCALHLVELAGRTTALVAAHIERTCCQDGQNLTKSQAELESISNTFAALEESHDDVKVETVSAVSAYATVHQDIYNTAEEKKAALVLLPFHKTMCAEGTLETRNAAFEDINQNVMQDAPCSVGIFVDWGIRSVSRTNLKIIVLFIGGPDDREALSVAWRMARHARVQLTVVKILLLDESAEVHPSNHDEAHGFLSAAMDSERQKELDEEFVNSFRLKAVNNEDSVTYIEKELHNGNDIPEMLNDLDQNCYDLYIVGQGKGRNLAVLSRLLKWCECPELGIIGDILASQTFGSNSSVLVVQQYGSGGNNFGPKTQQPSARDDGSDTLVVKTV